MKQTMDSIRLLFTFSEFTDSLLFFQFLKFCQFCPIGRRHKRFLVIELVTFCLSFFLHFALGATLQFNLSQLSRTQQVFYVLRLKSKIII